MALRSPPHTPRSAPESAGSPAPTATLSAHAYRSPGYPVVPLIFVAGTIWVVGSALVADPVTTLAGTGLTLLGIPVYGLWKRAERHRGVQRIRRPKCRFRSVRGELRRRA